MSDMLLQMYIGLHVKYRYSCQTLIQLDLSQKNFRKKHSNTNFHEIPSIGSGVVPCEQTDGRIGITNLKVAFLSFSSFSNGHHEAKSRFSQLFQRAWERYMILANAFLRLHF